MNKEKFNFNAVSAEVKKAYSGILKLRDLNFRACVSVTPTEAYEICKKYIPTYNNFKYSLLKLFPADCRITIAREGSVCLYVTGKNLPTQEELDANEYDKRGRETRIWWD